MPTRSPGASLFVALSLFLIPLSWWTPGSPAQSSTAIRVLQPALADLSAPLPLYFEANQGQFDGAVRFVLRERAGGGTFFFTPSHVAIVYARAASSPPPRLAGGTEGRPPPPRLAGGTEAGRLALKVHFANGTPNPRLVGLDPQPGRVHYFLGNDPAQWRTGVPTYGSLLYQDLYPHTDLRYRGDGGQLKYDLILRPGADLERIALDYRGVQDLRLKDTGQLEIETAWGILVEAAPLAWQETADGQRQPVDAGYRLLPDGSVGFWAAPHDPSRTLIIDPAVDYGTFLGGSGFDYVAALQLDAAGNIMVAGPTDSIDFPTTTGAYDRSHDGQGADIFVAKLSADGSSLLHSTYVGGSESDIPYALALDAAGNALVTGETYSEDLPTTGGAYDPTPSEYVYFEADTFVLKLRNDGAALLYSTFLEGDGSEIGHALAVDSAGNAFVTGQTTSPDFPTTTGAYDTGYNGGGEYYEGDAFLASLQADGSSLRYSTFLGGAGDDWGLGLALDGEGRTLVTGYTTSANFPTITGAYDTSHNGQGDAFVLRLSANGAALDYSTLLGGSGEDSGYSLAQDGAGSIFVSGTTTSPGFPTTPGAYDTSHNGGSDVFALKLSANAGSLLHSTFAGGSGDDWGLVQALDAGSNAVIVGRSASADFPTTTGALDTSHNGLDDAILIQVSANGSALGYSTFLGGSSNDTAYALALAGDGSAVVAGGTASAGFPTTTGAYDTTYNSGDLDGFVCKLPLPGGAPMLDAISNPDGDGDYQVEWSDVPGATSYTLQEDDDGAFGSPTNRYTGPDSQFSMTGQSPGTWYYRVRASSASGDGPWSATQSVVVDESVPAAPTLAPISNADGDGNYLVDWSDVTGATSYSLQEDDDNAFNSPTNRYTGPSSQFSVSGQPPGTWYYRVRASSAGGDGPWSNVQPVVVQAPAAADSYEDDDDCLRATTIPSDGTLQTHNFHDQGDEDWVTFQAQTGKTYVVQVANVGYNVDAVVMLYDACDTAPLASEDNAFGPTVRMEWEPPATGAYYLRLVQNDPARFGQGTNYDLSVAPDTEPPAAPISLRAAPDDQKLVVQWPRSPERDVATYVVWWGLRSGPPYSNFREVQGAGNTYHEISGLANGTLYYVALQAEDLSGNVSPYSREIAERPSPSTDATQPLVAVDRPVAGSVYTTTLSLLTVGGTATDAGGNLSRVHVRNTANGSEGWDYDLSGTLAPFSVPGISLVEGDNPLQVTVLDTAGNSGAASLTVRRLGRLGGVAVIVGGHNDSHTLQSNINAVTNRAYRIFLQAGLRAEDLYYLSPGPQDADGDGSSDVAAAPTPDNIHAALQWAATRLRPGVPFYLYMMDHGLVEAFCADGCSAGGRLSSEQLDAWLAELETASGADQVNVIVDACHAGSFVDRVNGVSRSISRNGRVVIASTGRNNNAYASAEGAYFSDAFFSAIAESNSLLASFERARAAVHAAGFNQTPWLDDNGDGLYNPTDGAHASDRYLAGYFGALLPRIVTASVTLDGAEGQITAVVARGDERLRTVWAAVYAPSFQEPDHTTLDLGVPLIKLETDAGGAAAPGEAGQYTAEYNGFVEAGAYRVVIYAEDIAGNQAQPRAVLIGGQQAYLPLVAR